MRSLWLLLLIGCEPMSEPGDLFSAAHVAELASAEPEQAESEPSFDFPELEVISSEDLQSGNFGAEDEPADKPEPEPTATDAPEAVAAVADEPEPEPAAADEPEPAVEAAVVSAPASAASAVAPAHSVSGWPVRLVKTLPETNPPRAILGLPSGEELVVSPGSMIPDHGLVVIAIGPNSAQIAQVTPQGDHAAISPVTLQTMY